MEQTAVEWLIEEIEKLAGIKISRDEDCVIKAKEMEDKQKHSEYLKGWYEGIDLTE
jgi:hypothetical protein